MNNMDKFVMMRTIRRNDPEGHKAEPTDADYTNFTNWVEQTYGTDALVDYYLDDWDTSTALYMN